MDWVLPERLRQRRVDLGLTQTDVAVHLDTNYSYIYRYEMGKTLPSASALLKLAIALQTTPNYLLGLTDDPEAVDLPSDLSEPERELLAYTRTKSPVQQRKIFEMAKNLPTTLSPAETEIIQYGLSQREQEAIRLMRSKPPETQSKILDLIKLL